jgi:kinesin family protein C2/C3
MEVYNEKIYDLLVGTRSEALEVHQSASGNTYVAGLKEEIVTTPEEVESVLARGDANRTVASTVMNTDSSRSHLVMQISVSGFNKISQITSEGKLTLVDLAGSERVSKSEATGARLVEAAAINKSLSALAHVSCQVDTG